MVSSLRPSCALLCLAACALPFAGCGVGLSTDPLSGASGAASRPISGALHGGQQPVVGASIQLYAANTTTDKGASTPLLTNPVTTDANGNFSITGDYTCPSSNPLVYIVATGGNPGLGGSTNNTALAMMSLLGTCNDLKTNASSTFIFIDELTTVVATYSLQPFMSDYAHVGASPTNQIGLGMAYDTSSTYINFSTGQFQTAGRSIAAPFATFNSIADIIGACVNSSGGTAGDNSACGKLFTNASFGGTPTETATAALHIVQSPSTNVAQLFALIPASPPFQPYFTAAPSDFTATAGFALPTAGTVRAGVLTSTGNVWLYTAGYTYNTTANTSTNLPGILTVYDNNFNQLFTIAPGTGGLYWPVSMAADNAGNVWVLNSNATLSKFNSAGAALSPSGGWPTGQSVTFSPTTTGNTYSNSALGSIFTDRVGGVHGYGNGGTNPNSCYFDVNSSGAVSTQVNGNYCATLNSSSLYNMTVDGAGDVWGFGYSNYGKENVNNGNLAALGPISQGCFYPYLSASGASNPTQAFESVTQNLIYDHVSNHVWGYSQTGAGTILNTSAAVFCDFGSATLPVIPFTTSSSTTPGSAYTGSSVLINNGVLDGAGNFWFVSSGVSATGTVATYNTVTMSATFNGTLTYSTWLGEISPTGTLLSPYNASNGTFGYQPTGLGANAPATGTNLTFSPGSQDVSLLGVDNAGNIWAFDGISNRLLKITGMAAANSNNY